MSTYRYKARTARGEAVSGVLDAESADALASRLFEGGITPIDINEVTASQDVLADLWRRLGGGRPQLTDLILFSRQMYAITKAGLPLLAGLKSLAASTPNQALRAALEAAIESLQTGRDLASSLARSSRVFSKFYISVVRVGEASGTLETAFLRLYQYLGMEQRIREKIKAALRYPATVVVAIGIAVTIITFWVLPRFAPIFSALGNHMSWATRVLLGVSSFGAEYWYVVIAAATAAIVGFRLYVRDGDGRYRWDRFKLRVPVIGAIVHRAMLARFCRSFALTLDAGVPMIQSLAMIARAIGNEYLTEKVLALRNGIEHGEGLQRTAQGSQLFTPLALQMIGVGEETGALGEMLDEVADFYEREVDHDLERLSAALEPMLIVGVGVMVLILALGIFLPLWDLAARAGSLG